jgi:tetratricopeptide (TPR) repeat protein
VVQHWYEFDFRGAEASYQRALEVAPDNAEVLRAAGLLAFCLGRFDEALGLCRRAIDLDPLSVSTYAYLARVYRGTGQLPEAESTFRKGLEMSPESTSVHLLLGLVLDAQGRREEALAEVMQEPANWARLYGLAIVHHTGGRPAESDAALSELTETCGTSAAYQVAGAHAGRGEIDAAFEWLERAYALRDSGVALTKVDPLLQPLHSDPRWQPFLRKVGLDLP